MSMKANTEYMGENPNSSFPVMQLSLLQHRDAPHQADCEDSAAVHCRSLARGKHAQGLAIITILLTH